MDEPQSVLLLPTLVSKYSKCKMKSKSGNRWPRSEDHISESKHLGAIPFPEKTVNYRADPLQPSPRSSRVGSRPSPAPATWVPEGSDLGSGARVRLQIQPRLFLPAAPGAQLLQAQPSRPPRFPALLRTAPHGRAATFTPLCGAQPRRPLTSHMRRSCQTRVPPGIRGLGVNDSAVGTTPGRDSL